MAVLRIQRHVLVAAALLPLLLAACRIEKIDVAAAAPSAPSPAGSFDNKAFDPSKQVAAM